MCYHFTSTQHETPDFSEVHRLLQNCGSSEWNLIHITLLAPGIRKWLLISIDNLWISGLTYRILSVT